MPINIKLCYVDIYTYILYATDNSRKKWFIYVYILVIKFQVFGLKCIINYSHSGEVSKYYKM